MLEKYRSKRDFERTPEPPPQEQASDRNALIFVVQKHAATRLHYDFRLEADGVLKSWAVPKGPSVNPGEKRLAVMVEDHPLDYANFEGVIPKGEYGAGQVIVWDIGIYSPDEDGKLSFNNRAEAEERLRRGIEKGKISVFLQGRKLKGSWALVKMQRTENEWLLIKHQDQFADASREVLEEGQSAISGLTIEDLKAGKLPAAQSAATASPGETPGARKAQFPTDPAPMLATLADAPFSHHEWLFEPKLDGIRAIALVRNGEVKLHSRRGIDISKQHPLIAQDLAQQVCQELILDGEIIALDEEGRPSFQAIQPRINLTKDADIRRAEAAIPVFYYAFDILYADGYDLRKVPLRHRKALLQHILLPTDRVSLLESFEAEGEAAYKASLEHGIEGIVAKHRESLYESGKRSSRWLKIKATLSAEFIIGGYSQGLGSRGDAFGALLLGYRDDKGRLIYVGHVGTGFDDRSLADLRLKLDSIKTDRCPFVEKPPMKTPVTWVAPELVAEVKFAEWTRDKSLRAPVFLRLREDISAKEVRDVEIVHPSSGDAETHGSDADPKHDLQGLLEQLENKKDKLALSVGGHEIAVSNLNKVMWPAFAKHQELTKRDFIIYLGKVAQYIIPHLLDRPLTLIRYPNGIHGKHFYQKHWDNPLPTFVETVRLFSEHNNEDQEYMLCNNLPTLLWLGQLADLEFHVWASRVDKKPDGAHLPTSFTGSVENIERSLLNYPDFVFFDLDPYIYSGREKKGAEPELNRKAFEKTCEVALWLKDLLDSLSLVAYVKTTGRTGLHIYVPVLRQFDYDAVRKVAETVCRFVAQDHRADVTMEWMTEKRTGKVFLDHNQNTRGKTLASVYSPRAAPEASVSVPVSWDELPTIYPTDFTILTTTDRLSRVGDLWANILRDKKDLKGLINAKE